MDNAGNVSSDILGIELGRRVIRGVRLDHYRAELTAVAECELLREGLSPEGIIDVAVFAPVLEDLLARLKVTDRSRVRIGLSVGPRNSGVGSGPAVEGWLLQQAKNLKENLQRSGGLGVAFVPSRAVDAAIKLSRDAGIDLARLDLAPVAAARAIGVQVDDRICLGSGHGWQARMRDLEVLEAKENLLVGFDDPMTLVDRNGEPRAIESYGWVQMSPGLEQAGGMNMSQMAVAVGVAIGIAYGSPADLLQSTLVPGEPDESEVDPALAHLAGYEVTPESASEATLRLMPPARPQLPTVRPAARRPEVQTPESLAVTVQRAPGSVTEEVLPLADTPPAGPTELPRVAAEVEAKAVPKAGPSSEQDAELALQAELQRQSQPGLEAEYARQFGLAQGGVGAQAVAELDRTEVAEAEVGEIEMFSPEGEADEMLGARERRLAVDAAVAVSIVLALAVLLFVIL